MVISWLQLRIGINFKTNKNEKSNKNRYGI